jgi:hypothetical protein
VGGAEPAARVPGEAPVSPPPPPPTGKRARQVELAAPSFAGRRVSTITGLFGKVLLLLGLILAVGQGPMRDRARIAIEEGHLEIDSAIVERGIPVGAVLGLCSVGCLLLVVARRHDGAMHFLRGCLGCAFMFGGVLIAHQSGAPVLRALFEAEDLGAIKGAMWDPLIGMALTFGPGMLLLLWPKPDPNRPIVI